MDSDVEQDYVVTAFEAIDPGKSGGNPGEYVGALLESFFGDTITAEKWLSRHFWLVLAESFYVFGREGFDGGAAWTSDFKKNLEEDEDWQACADSAVTRLELSFLRPLFVWHLLCKAIEHACERLEEHCLYKSLLDYQQRHREIIPAWDHTLELRCTGMGADFHIVDHIYRPYQEGDTYFIVLVIS